MGQAQGAGPGPGQTGPGLTGLTGPTGAGFTTGNRSKARGQALQRAIGNLELAHIARIARIARIQMKCSYPGLPFKAKLSRLPRAEIQDFLRSRSNADVEPSERVKSQSKRKLCVERVQKLPLQFETSLLQSHASDVSHTFHVFRVFHVFMPFRKPAQRNPSFKDISGRKAEA